MRKINYIVTARFGREVLTAQKNDFSDVENLVKAVFDLGGSILEIVAEELPSGVSINGSKQ